MREPAYPLLRLVTSPDPAADVRFDFNDGTTWAVAGLDMGTPTLLGDADAVGAEYDYRRPAFRVNITGPELEVYARCQALAQAMMRGDNYLFFQHSAITPPVWLELLRSNPGSVTPRRVHRDRDENTWALDLALTAEPFALGAQESFSLTITNDPATGGLSATLPEIRGDAPASLVVEVDAGTTDYVQPFISVAPVDGTASWPVFWQAESWTLGTDTTVVADASASGGSTASLALSTTEKTPARRVTGMVTVPFAGRWRLFARVRATRAGGALAMATTITGAGAAASEPVSTVTDAWDYTENTRLIDLGVFAFPKGNMPASKPYTLATAEVGIDMGGIVDPDGTGAIAVDYVVAVPIDLPLDGAGSVRTLAFQNAAQTSGDVVLRLDGEHGQVMEISSGALGVASPEVPAGDFLAVTPGAENVLILLPRRGEVGSGTADAITDSTTLTVSYRPRYVYLAGS